MDSSTAELLTRRYNHEDKPPHPADLIAYADHETMMQVLNAIAARIAALPESAEECHGGSINAHSYSSVMRLGKVAAVQAVETIREVLKGYVAND